jgi:hypothetical protein
MISRLKNDKFDDNPDEPSPTKMVIEHPQAKHYQPFNEHIGIDIQSKDEDSYSMGLE